MGFNFAKSVNSGVCETWPRNFIGKERTNVYNTAARIPTYIKCSEADKEQEKEKKGEMNFAPQPCKEIKNEGGGERETKQGRARGNGTGGSAEGSRPHPCGDSLNLDLKLLSQSCNNDVWLREKL